MPTFRINQEYHINEQANPSQQTDLHVDIMAQQLPLPCGACCAHLLV